MSKILERRAMAKSVSIEARLEALEESVAALAAAAKIDLPEAAASVHALKAKISGK